MARAYLGLGSNIGDKRAMIARALDLLGGMQGIAVAGRSGDYRTPPWGDTDQDWFVNACAAIDTVLEPAALLATCLAVEDQLGRRRTRKWGPRSIDIDLLDYDGQAVNQGGLILPHPFVLDRAFVLVPLAELAPDLIIAGSAVRDAAARLDTAGIERLS
jgi:2-amino-4-hydroxy-6-hydroxymethyldihydropteridine diphosphokinase